MRYHIKILWVIFFIGTFIASAQDKKELDIETIKSMCGCHQVEFNFAETFQYSDDISYVGSKVKQVGGTELVKLVSESEDKLVIQHLLVIPSENGKMVMKHWRQDWEYENREFYSFHSDNLWLYEKKRKSEVKGQWTQRVFQVDDSPRYEGSGTWVYVDGKRYWRNEVDAPLPRREYTTRSDYNVLFRRNHVQVSDGRWMHEQDNDKIIRERGEDILLAQEKGLNVYTRIDAVNCNAAEKWWAENFDKWAAVRAHWDKIFAEDEDLRLHKRVDNKTLFSHLFSLPADADKKKLQEHISSFIVK